MNHPLPLRVRGLIACSAFIVLELPAHATLLAYDGFDTTQYVSGGGYAVPVYGTPSSSNALVYDPNTSVGDGDHTAQNPPTYGFTGAWQHADAVNSTVYARVQNSQLSYSGLQTTTGQVSIARGASGSAAAKRFDRSLAIGNSTGYGSTLYIAGIIQPTSATAFGLRFIYSGDGRYFEFSVDNAGLTSLYGSGVPADTATTAAGLWTANTANFFVLKIENSVLGDPSEVSLGDQMSLYINPQLSSEGANAPGLQYGTANSGFFVSGNAGFSLATMRLSATPGQSQSVVFDELKIATTWEDLTTTIAIPEPAAFSLAIIGMIPLLRRKR